MIKFKNPGLIPIVFIVVATALLLSLSVWQFKRMTSKEGLLTQIETAMKAPAVTSVSGDVAYHKAMLTGRYVEDKTLHFIASKSNGFMHVTPLRLDDSDEVVLVSRGWFPALGAPKAEPDMVTVQGVLRPLRSKRLFSPDNAPEKNVWFTENVEELNAATGLKLAPYVLETGSLPPLRNDHLGYAVTWLILAIIGLVMFGIYFREKDPVL